MWSTGEGNGKPLQHSCLENPMNSMKRQKDRTLRDDLPRLVGAQYATGDQWRNNSRKNEGMEPKQKQYPVVNVVMLQARISEPTERESKSTMVMQRQEGSFISSVLGPKSHPAQQNPTRAPNKGVWRLIYRQFFVSVTGVAGVT